MEAPTYIPDTALPQSQQGSSDLPPRPGSSQVNAEASPEEEDIRYLCPYCDKDYAQRQGVWLHIRTAHRNPKQCFFCKGRFHYARPYQYRDHLRKEHPSVNPNVILGKAPGSRRRATIATEYFPQQTPVSPPAVQQDQQDRAESQPNRSTPSSPAPAGVSGVTSVSPPAVSSVNHNSQPLYADSEQMVTMDEDEYAPGSEVLDATYHLAVPLSTDERAEPNDVDVPLQDGMPSAHPGGSTASHSASNPEMVPIPPHSPAIGENYGALVSEDPMVGSFGPPIHYSPLSDAEIDATFDSIFNCTF